MTSNRPTPLVLIHGGSFAASCWDLMVEHLRGPALAVDLPGRGAHPAPFDSITLRATAASVVADIDAAGFDDVVLVGHSMAGVTMPGAIGLLGDRVRHAVFVACTVPEHGIGTLEALDPGVKQRAVDGEHSDAGMLTPELARMFFGNDLDDEQFDWMLQRMVPEAPGLPSEPVDLTPLQASFPRTWVRPLHDAILPAELQLRFARNAGDCRVVDIDAAHMCMISKPAELAALLDEIAADPLGDFGLELSSTDNL